MTSEEYIELYQKYISGKCTSEEEQRLFEYKDNFKLQKTTLHTISKDDKVLRRQIYNRINCTISSKESNIFKLLYNKIIKTL